MYVLMTLLNWFNTFLFNKYPTMFKLYNLRNSAIEAYALLFGHCFMNTYEMVCL